MAKITQDVGDAVEQVKVIAPATTSEVGEPNVIPIAYKKILSNAELMLRELSFCLHYCFISSL